MRVAPAQQATSLFDDAAHAQRIGERGDQREVVGDRDDAVVADLRPGEVGARVGDQLGGLRRRLAQLQPAGDGVEVRVALQQDALLLGAEAQCRFERRARVELDRLDLEVALPTRQARVRRPGT